MRRAVQYIQCKLSRCGRLIYYTEGGCNMKNKVRYRVIYTYILTSTAQLILISWLNKAIDIGIISEVVGLFAAGAVLFAGGAVYYAKIQRTISGKEREI